MGIIDIFKKKRLESLLLKAKSDGDIINALGKTFPRKKVKPIDDAWNYLVKNGYIGFGDEDKEPQQEYK